MQRYFCGLWCTAALGCCSSSGGSNSRWSDFCVMMCTIRGNSFRRSKVEWRAEVVATNPAAPTLFVGTVFFFSFLRSLRKGKKSSTRVIIRAATALVDGPLFCV